MTCFVIIFISCPELPVGISSLGPSLVQPGSSLIIFPVPLGLGKLALSRQNFILTCVKCSLRILAYLAGIWMGLCLSVCLYIFQYIKSPYIPHIHCYIYTSILMFIHLLLCLYIHQYVYTSVFCAVVGLLSCQIVQRL